MESKSINFPQRDGDSRVMARQSLHTWDDKRVVLRALSSANMSAFLVKIYHKVSRLRGKPCIELRIALDRFRLQGIQITSFLNV